MESSYVFMLREGVNTLEIQYNEQSGSGGGVNIAEAQINITGEHINGGCYFDIDNVGDMDRLISYLTELRGKIDKHYKREQILSHVNQPVGDYVEKLKSTLTPEQMELIEGTPTPVVYVDLGIEDKVCKCGVRITKSNYITWKRGTCVDCNKASQRDFIICKIANCGNQVEPGTSFCFIHPLGHL